MPRKAKLALVTTMAAAAVLAGCRTPNVGGPGAVQGWSDQARADWYNADQGSRLMPLAWFEALEQPSASGKFLDAAYLANFRILPPWPGQKLPIGFAVDRIDDDSGLSHTSLHWTGAPAASEKVDWVGLNCAACHTGRMSYAGKAITVDGAPSLFDFQSFIEALDTALIQTRDAARSGAADPGRWDRFAGAVLGGPGGGGDNPDNRKRLLAELDKLIAWEAATEALNHTSSRYGYGRVDAVGHIYNRVLLFGGAPQPTPNAADAPVSYPHLWNITKETQLQWDGIAQNSKINIGAMPTDFGALGRNTGEVLGVFGEVVIKKPSPGLDLTGFASTANVTNLNAMEVLLTQLKPPAWPSAAFGTPGDVDVTGPDGHKLSRGEVLKAGEGLFNANCAACHTPHAHYETMKTFAEMGKANLTDEWMACNAWAYTGASGALTGVKANYVSGDPLTANEPVRALLTTAVKGSLIGKKREFIQAAAANIFGVTPLPKVLPPQFALPAPETPKQQRLRHCLQNASDPLMAYKARPLEGIWATAPYLHNGSVPTLYDLLSPPEARPASFKMGARDFDPKKVGYVTDPSAPGNSFTFDTSLPGNSNKGHNYGVGALTPAQRLELLEYLKGL